MRKYKTRRLRFTVSRRRESLSFVPFCRFSVLIYFLELMTDHCIVCHVCNFIFYAFVHCLRDLELQLESVYCPSTLVTHDHVSLSLFYQQTLLECNQAKCINLGLKVSWGYSFSCHQNEHGSKFSQQQQHCTPVCAIDFSRAWPLWLFDKFQKGLTFAKCWLLSLFLPPASLSSTNCTLASFDY